MLRKSVVTVAAVLTVSACGSTATPMSNLATGTPGPSASAMVRQLTPAVTAQLDTAIKQAMQKAAIPGVIVGLWVPGDGSYVRAFGVADTTTKAPITLDMNTRIGSVTKTFTVSGILSLVDQHKLGLDDPISKYLSGVPQGDHITLRQLAEMRSGLYSYSDDPDFVKALITNPNRPFTPQELLGYSFKHPLVFPPGTQFEYSNTNTILLGLVIEKVSGQPLGTFLKQQVLAPSHLDHTVFPVGAEFPAPQVHGYTNQTATGAVTDATNWNPSWGWAAGAMISNLADLHTWAPILATGGTLITPATQAERLKILPSSFPGLGYGLGIFRTNGWTGHNGSLPGYQTVVMYLPQTKATMVVIANTDVAAQGVDPSTLIAQTITGIASPGNVYTLPSGPPTSSPAPTHS